MQEIAVRKNPFSIEYIVNPSEKIQMLAVKKYPRSLERIKNPTENVKKVANELLKK